MKGKHEEWSVSSVEKLLVGSTCFTACSLAQKDKDPLYWDLLVFPWDEVCVMLEVGWSLFCKCCGLACVLDTVGLTVSLRHPPENCCICWTSLCKFIDILVLTLMTCSSLGVHLLYFVKFNDAFIVLSFLLI